MKSKKGKIGIFAAAAVIAGAAAGAVTAGVILPQQNYINISCYYNNGTPVIEQRVRKGSAITLPTPTKDGCNFIGWYLDEEMNEEVTTNTKFTKNASVYAGYEVASVEAVEQAETQGLKTIGAGAFKGCTNLKNFTIPASVISIGANAFEGCNITNLYIEGDIYKTATTASALGGALTAAQNVYVNNAVELATRNTYFLEGSTFYYKETANGYTHFTKEANLEKKFRVKFYNTNSTLLDDTDVRYRGSAIVTGEVLSISITSTGVMKSAWVTSAGGTSVATLTEIKEDKNVYKSSTSTKQTLNECSWNTIKEAGRLGYQAGCFAVGDEKQVTLTDGTVMTMQLADFNHDVNTSGSTIPYTFVTKELLPSSHNKANGKSGSNVGSWTSDNEIKNYLDSTIENMLPLELRAYIVAAKKKTVTGGGSSTTVYENVSRLFLLSLSEINYDTTSAGYKDEGTPYALFANWSSNSDRKKYYVDTGASYNWWLRSPGSGDYSSFWNVMFDGALRADYASNTFALSFAFCV